MVDAQTYEAGATLALLALGFWSKGGNTCHFCWH